MNKATALHSSLKQVLLLSLLAIGGCAYQYIDANGNHRVLGIANVVIPAADRHECKAQGITVTATGINISNLPSHGGISIGYSRYTSIAIPVFTDASSVVNPEGDSQ